MAETDLTSKSENIKTDDKKPTEGNSADNQSESKFKVPFFISSGIVVALFFTLISVLYIQHKSVQHCCCAKALHFCSRIEIDKAEKQRQYSSDVGITGRMNQSACRAKKEQDEIDDGRNQHAPHK